MYNKTFQNSGRTLSKTILRVGESAHQESRRSEWDPRIPEGRTRLEKEE
jgi:hypothetical protein